uniref:hypothetical protein n=1 Tax=uncultured Draconibacterium sp. TaxID=1573823 RepID=UPI0032175972
MDLYHVEMQLYRTEMKNPRQKCNCTTQKWGCTWYDRFLCGFGWFCAGFPEVACDLCLLDNDNRSQTGETQKNIRIQ